MQQKLHSLKIIFPKRKTIISLSLFILAVFFIQQQFLPDISLPFKNTTLPNSENIALASPACDPNACARYGTICCPGIESCVVWWEDENNCGRCGRRCAGGAECRLNVPGDYTKGAGCFCRPDWCGAYGAICCPGIEGCVNWMIDPNNCGGCGIKCGTGYKCSSGKCVDGTPPALNITNPQNGATVSGTVELRADAADPQSPVEWVKFAVKKRTALSSTTICQDYSFPYSCPWDTTGFADSDYYVYAWAKSQGGESIRSISVKVSKAPPGQCTEGCIACGLWRNADCSTRAEGWCCGSPSPHCPCDGPKTGCGICEADCGADPACDGVKPGTSGCDNNCRKVISPGINTPTISTFCEGTISKATISWTGGDGSQGFWVDIDKDSNWQNGFWNKKVSSRSTTAPDGFNPVFGASGPLVFSGGISYYVRIFDPKLEQHSPTASFVAKRCLPPALGKPILKEPQNGATNISNNPTFKWSEVTGAGRYGVWLGEDSDFSTGPFWAKNAYPQNCSATSCSIGWQNGSGWTSQRGAPSPPSTLTAGKTYYWLVWACTDGECPLSGISQIFSFTVAGIPPLPTLGQPARNLRITSQSCEGERVKVIFEWIRAEENPSAGVVIDGQWLDLSLYRENTFAPGNFIRTHNPPYKDSISYITGTGQIGHLDPGKTHYWRINTYYTDGRWHPSATATFTTDPCRPPPGAVCPLNTNGGWDPDSLKIYGKNKGKAVSPYLECKVPLVMRQESNFRWNALGSAWERGVLQYMVGTWDRALTGMGWDFWNADVCPSPVYTTPRGIEADLNPDKYIWHPYRQIDAFVQWGIGKGHWLEWSAWTSGAAVGVCTHLCSQEERAKGGNYCY